MKSTGPLLQNTLCAQYSTLHRWIKLAVFENCDAELHETHLSKAIPFVIDLRNCFSQPLEMFFEVNLIRPIYYSMLSEEYSLKWIISKWSFLGTNEIWKSKTENPTWTACKENTWTKRKTLTNEAFVAFPYSWFTLWIIHKLRTRFEILGTPLALWNLWSVRFCQTPSSP